jgi:hypothetical protein
VSMRSGFQESVERGQVNKKGTYLLTVPGGCVQMRAYYTLQNNTHFTTRTYTCKQVRASYTCIHLW